MRHCKYCANTDTKLDEYGYCKKYDCLSRSGKREELELFNRKVSDILYNSPNGIGQVSGPVSNFYSTRHRALDTLLYEIRRSFGCVPLEIQEKITFKYKGAWDKNIRW